MFESLSDRLQETFRRIRGQSAITESNIADSLREVRLALLDADVNVEVVQSFIDSVREKCLGQEVIRSVTPGQQFVKIIHDHLVELLGGDAAELKLDRQPSVIMLVGLHGSGKTTTAGKLANYLKKQLHKQVLLVAGDVYRPAAIDQLEALGNQIGVEVYTERSSVNVSAIAANAVEYAQGRNIDAVILDTAGRLQIDENMIQELIRIRQTIVADEVLLVADSALGQEAVSVAQEFHKALELTGFILTKLDGDAKGGAAISIRSVTHCPVKFVGTGEKLENLDTFHPDRMAGRILGMGDVVSLVEQAAGKIDEEEARKLEENLRKNRFDFNDFLSQLKQIRRLGGMESILKFLPGGRQAVDALDGAGTKQFSRMEAMILSMTPAERDNPDSLDFARKRRIAKGCGLPVEEVSGMIKQFMTMRKMMRGNGAIRQMLSGGMPADHAMMNNNAFLGGATATFSRKEQEKKKRLAKLKKQAIRKQRKKK
ncbi:MAG: signal recognition particle protein [Victivallaceae bacterium]|nr:signal recognition particle protein [Victivallaceae bacterium]